MKLTRRGRTGERVVTESRHAAPVRCSG